MRKRSIGLSIILISVAILLFGCDQRITRTTDSIYKLYGAVIKNYDNDSSLVSIEFKKNDTVTTSAILLMGSDSLKYSNGLYQESYNTANALGAGNLKLHVIESDFSDSISFVVPAELAITSISLPENHINPGGVAVQLEASISAGSNGYAFGVIKKDSAYKSNGYSQFVTAASTSITIPLEAFRLSGNPDTPDTGWYYVYVYSYYGSPTQIKNLPTKFPDGLVENISKLNLSGSFGTIIISRPDSIHVTILQ
jgi:hypothetical protein